MVYLGDIASITPKGSEAETLAAERITASPNPGKSRTIKASTIIDMMRYNKDAAGISWSGTESIEVTRKGQAITKEQMKGIVAEYIGRHLKNLPDAEIRFTSVRTPGDIILPTGKITYTVRPSKPTIIGSSSFNILFAVDGRTVKNCTVRGKLEALASVATAAVNVRRGSIITPEQVEMIRQDISKLDAPYFSMDRVDGLQAKRTIRAGKPLDTMNVAPPPVIKKGEPVEIIASRGPLRISTKGIATMDGRPGDFIRVKNISSSKLVYCKVDAPGVVSVEF
ncbi:MAG TPA: flagellar basal body P-ring formation protein FlgA [Desulfobulbaceae bacterium]|nr:flagellar basal body P-ring formation protein FlgA [Desulfobulbaceae bacterium]